MAWRNLGADGRECQFNPRRKGARLRGQPAKNASLSAELRPRLPGQLDLAYGETPLQKVDLFPTKPRGKRPAPIFRDLILRAQGDEPFRPAPAQAGPATPVDAQGGLVDDRVDSIGAWFDIGRRRINPISD